MFSRGRARLKAPASVAAVRTIAEPSLGPLGGLVAPPISLSAWRFGQYMSGCGETSEGLDFLTMSNSGLHPLIERKKLSSQFVSEDE